MINKILNGLKAQNHKYIAKAISIIENKDSQSSELLNDIFPVISNTIKIGITGPPGAGKSSITNHLIKKYRSEGKSVCALLVDPTSPFTQGAVLGDRIRMKEFYNDNSTVIRSIASRGSKEGLCEDIDNIEAILEYTGFDIIIYETVGVGQVELDVVESVDTVIVVLVPESGDDIQIMKAGLIEIADIYIINKCDRKDSDKLYLTLSNMLQLTDKKNWLPKIVKTIAIENIGIEDLYKELSRHTRYLITSNQIKKKNNNRYINNIKSKIVSDFESTFWTKERIDYLDSEINKELKNRKSIGYIFKKLKSL